MLIRRSELWGAKNISLVRILVHISWGCDQPASSPSPAAPRDYGGHTCGSVYATVLLRVAHTPTRMMRAALSRRIFFNAVSSGDNRLRMANVFAPLQPSPWPSESLQSLPYNSLS